jgi:site-specific recombinase XerD
MPDLASSLQPFLRSLVGRNISPLTIQAYETDVRQFLEYVERTNVAIAGVEQISRADIVEYLSCLSDQQRSGVTRARKLAAIREFFRYLEADGRISSSPAAGVAIPKKECKAKVYLRPDEYMRLLAAAGGNARDFAILQLFLQTGIRVSELANLLLSHLDLHGRTLHVEAGKGKKDRVIALEKKAIQALKHYLSARPTTGDEHLFLNCEGRGLSIRGVQDIVEKYAQRAGITKKFSAHSLRHTFATHKARQGISPWQLKEWMGHSSIATTQIYVHMGEDARKQMEATSL